MRDFNDSDLKKFANIRFSKREIYQDSEGRCRDLEELYQRSEELELQEQSQFSVIIIGLHSKTFMKLIFHQPPPFIISPAFFLDRLSWMRSSLKLFVNMMFQMVFIIRTESKTVPKQLNRSK